MSQPGPPDKKGKWPGRNPQPGGKPGQEEGLVRKLRADEEGDLTDLITESITYVIRDDAGAFAPINAAIRIKNELRAAGYEVVRKEEK